MNRIFLIIGFNELRVVFIFFCHKIISDKNNNASNKNRNPSKQK